MKNWFVFDVPTVLTEPNITLLKNWISEVYFSNISSITGISWDLGYKIHAYVPVWVLWIPNPYNLKGNTINKNNWKFELWNCMWNYFRINMYYISKFEHTNIYIYVHKHYIILKADKCYNHYKIWKNQQCFHGLTAWNIVIFMLYFLYITVISLHRMVRKFNL